MTSDEIRVPPRVWLVAAIAAVLICWIGWNTQQARNENERQARETTAFAQQTQDCLNQLQTVLVDRSEYTTQLDELQNQLNTLQNKRNDVWTKFIVDLVKIPTNQPTADRDAQAAPIVQAFIADINKIDSARAEILNKRGELLNERAKNPIPDPTCGQKIPE